LWYKQWRKEGLKLFGNEKAMFFFYYWCDVLKLTEHGGCIPGWLSEKGKNTLSDLEDLFGEENENNTTKKT